MATFKEAWQAGQGLWRPQFLSPTWLNNFPFPSPAPLIPLSSLSDWPEQAGADFLILGLSSFQPVSSLPQVLSNARNDAFSRMARISLARCPAGR